MKFIPVLILSAALLGTPAVFGAENTDAKSDTTAADLSAVLKKLDDMEARLADLARRVDSISKFLGDTQAGSIDTVDRRLRDIERSLDDVKRDVERLR